MSARQGDRVEGQKVDVGRVVRPQGERFALKALLFQRGAHSVRTADFC
jgi:hypothetical protein